MFGDARFHEMASTLAASICMLVLSAIVFFSDPKSRSHRLFTAYTLSIAWWTVSYFLACTAPTLAQSLFWLRFEKLGASFIPYLFLLTLYDPIQAPIPQIGRAHV